ncbi:MAG: hypothetical protein HQ594_02325 [Candidatus Omnitrophica bacterium]|nr:hypothetical protein [Candidatus Omnitrophota bacterium]
MKMPSKKKINISGFKSVLRTSALPSFKKNRKSKNTIKLPVRIMRLCPQAYSVAAITGVMITRKRIKYFIFLEFGSAFLPRTDFPIMP